MKPLIASTSIRVTRPGLGSSLRVWSRAFAAFALFSGTRKTDSLRRPGLGSSLRVWSRAFAAFALFSGTRKTDSLRRPGLGSSLRVWSRAFAAFALLLATAMGAGEKSFLTQANRVAWAPITPPGAPPGLMQRVLHDNKDKELVSAIVKFPKGYIEPRHYHTKCGHSIYVLKGRIKASGAVWTPGSFHYAAVMEPHGPLEALEESEILFYTDGPFDYHVEKR